MDYTTSDANVTHGGTGHRMHQDSAPVTTVLSAKDANQIIWSLMEVLAAGGMSAATFDPSNPNTYNRLRLAIQALAAGSFNWSNQLLSANGYKVFPAGGANFILQWGVYTADIAVAGSGATTPVVVTLPMTYPNACLHVGLTTRNPSNDYLADSWPELVSRAANQFTMVPQNQGVVPTSLLLHGFDWFSVGW